MASRRDLGVAAVATAASAVLFFFGTGFAPVAALAWLAPLPVLALAPRVSGRVAFGAGALAYLLGSAGTWPYYLDSIDVPLPAALSIILGSSALLGLGALLLRALIDRPLLAAVAPGALWCGAVYLVSLVSPIGMMYQLATSVTDLPVVTQVAALTGAWGVEFLVLFVPSAVAVLTVAGAHRARTAVVAGLVVVATLGFGIVRLGADEPPGRTVATVAANEPHWAADVAEPAGRDLVQSYVDRIAALPDGVDLVVLPEGNFAADDASLPALVEPMRQVARGTGADIVAGVVLGTGGKRYNVSLAIPAAGGEPVAYRKWHIGGGPLSTGDELGFLDSATGLQNCLDLNFPDPSRTYAREGARLMAIPAADGDLNGWQHARQGLLRGVENGFAVAWSAQLGTSLLADGHGRPLAEAATISGPGFAVTVADVPDGPGATPYSRLGDWFAWLCLAVTLGVCVLARTRVGKPTWTREEQQVTTR